MKDMIYNTNAVIEVTKEFTFDSAHYLENYNGPCANLHGHTYKLQVTIRGRASGIGMVLDFKDLKEIVNNLVISFFDHQEINALMTYNPTAENMVVYIYESMEKFFLSHYQDVRLKSVKLWETPTSFAEYRGETNL